MVRTPCVTALVLLVAFGAPAGGPSSRASRPDDRLSPSFTWGSVAAPTGAAGLSGVYQRAAIVTELNVAARRTVTQAKRTYWCFLPDGRCYYSMPTEGLDNFNYDYVKAMNPLWCSTYALRGDEGTITWGTGGTTIPLRRSGTKLLIGRNADVYEPLASCDGLKLQGTYKRDDWQDEISWKQGISFSRDGTFVDEGFLGGAISTWWWADRGMVEATFSPGTGNYHVTHNSLVLLYSDGRRLRANFHLADDATSENVNAFLVSTRRFIRVK